MQLTDAAMQLTDEQVQSVKQQGFLCVPRIASDEEALKIKASLERLFREKAGGRKEPMENWPPATTMIMSQTLHKSFFP